jgi:lipoate---protein ligase
MDRMRILDLTLPTPAENLALDEALLEEAETADQPLETLRFWEPAQNMVVVGRSSRVETEVHQDACRDLGIPIFRRISGGAAIVTGPGCLMYGLVLSLENHPYLRVVKQAHAFVLDTLKKALNTIPPSPFGKGTQRVPGGEGIHYCGTSDLALSDLKFSGNSMRCRKRNLLYHGTILYNFPLELITRCLKIPPRMPDYRNHRDHKTFVANLPLLAEDIKRALTSAWNAVEPLNDWPRELTSRLAAEKYGNPQWNALL